MPYRSFEFNNKPLFGLHLFLLLCSGYSKSVLKKKIFEEIIIVEKVIKKRQDIMNRHIEINSLRWYQNKWNFYIKFFHCCLQNVEFLDTRQTMIFPSIDRIWLVKVIVVGRFESFIARIFLITFKAIYWCVKDIGWR